MKFRSKAALLSLSLFLIIAVASTRNGDLFFQIKKNLTIFSDVYKEIATLYVDEVSPQTVMRRAIDAMLGTLDPYTVFVGEGEQQEMEILSSGNYGGIGIEAGYRGDRIVIIAPLEGYPAQRAGILPGDVIISIDGIDTKGLSAEEVQQLTVGEVGSAITITIDRFGIDRPLEFELQRERIEIRNISFASLIGDEKNIAYVHLSRFGQNTAEELRQSLIEFSNQTELKGIILDLRNNPGGLLTEAVEVVDKFIEPGVMVVETRGRIQEQSNMFLTDEPPLFGELPLIVLQNEGSASASEIVAGALQDVDRAVIIGEKSFGKGLVQIIRPLSYNTSLKLTVSRYYIPSGRSIQSVDNKNNGIDGSDSESDTDRRSFLTRNGRTVFDGQGVDPDLKIEADRPSYTEIALMQNNHPFFFINEYVNRNPDAGTELPESAFEDFVNYLQSQNFEYTTPADQYLEALSNQSHMYSNPAVVEEQLDKVRETLRLDKQQNLADSRDTIIKMLQSELLTRKLGRSERQEALLKMDSYVLEAIWLLNDPQKYNAILKQ
jgi:carboxyl-terminal processing protease